MIYGVRAPRSSTYEAQAFTKVQLDFMYVLEMGKMPPAGSTVRMTVSASRGDYTLAINQPLTPAGDYATLASILDIKNDSAIRSGAGHETTEETRNRAQYYVPYDGQVVWGGDYRYYIQNKVPNLVCC